MNTLEETALESIELNSFIPSVQSDLSDFRAFYRLFHPYRSNWRVLHIDGLEERRIKLKFNPFRSFFLDTAIIDGEILQD